MQSKVPEDYSQFDPKRHKVWRVSCELRWIMYVVAEDDLGAERIAQMHAREELQEMGLVPKFYPSEMYRPRPVDDGTLPWGPINWQGKELTLNQAVELVNQQRPVYDTETELMPFADSPPPLSRE